MKHFLVLIVTFGFIINAAADETNRTFDKELNIITVSLGGGAVIAGALSAGGTELAIDIALAVTIVDFSIMTDGLRFAVINPDVKDTVDFALKNINEALVQIAVKNNISKEDIKKYLKTDLYNYLLTHRFETNLSPKIVMFVENQNRLNEYDAVVEILKTIDSEN